MVCGNCGATNPEGTNYCGRCGAPLSSAACSSALETESSKADSRVELCWFLHRFAAHTQKAMPAYKAMEKNIRIANRYGAKNYDLQPLAGKYVRTKGLIMTIGGVVCAGYFAVTSLKDGALATGQADPIAHAIETAIIGAFYFAPLIYGVFVLFLRQRARKKIKHNKAMVKKYEALAEENAAEIFANYRAFSENWSRGGNPIIPFKYANPSTLEAIFNVIIDGNADSIKEAILRLKRDKDMQEMMDKANRQAAEIDSLSQQVSSLGNELNYRWW